MARKPIKFQAIAATLGVDQANTRLSAALLLEWAACGKTFPVTMDGKQIGECRLGLDKQQRLTVRGTLQGDLPFGRYAVPAGIIRNSIWSGKTLHIMDLQLASIDLVREAVDPGLAPIKRVA